jgi:hypothetical protein
MRLTLPLQGIWVATLQVSADDDLSGALTLENDAVKYSGFVLRGTSVSGTALVDAVGGTGGLGKVIEARSYQGASARDILLDLLTAAGEKLDGASTREILSTALPFWTRARERASLGLSSLSDAVGARWRVRPSGAVWLGAETWPEMPPDYDALELDRDSAAGSVLLAPETIGLMPGVTLRGERVGRVEHVMDEEPIRTTFWLETAA